MTEAAVINLFTVVRILLVGGIFMVIPLITRKGLLFGAYVGEEVADRAGARGLVRRWYVVCLTVMALSLAIGLGISLAGRPVAGNLTATAILIIAIPVFYVRQYYAARKLAPPDAGTQAGTAVASLEQDRPRGTTLAMVVLLLSIVAGFATVIHATVSYEAMPERVPTHFGLSGEADAWKAKSVGTVLLLPTMNLVLSPFLALLALLTAGAKQSIRGGSGGRSVEAQQKFRAGMANLLSGTALFTCALMTYLSVQSIRVGLSEIPSLGTGILWITGAMLVFLLGGLAWIITRYGQGGALIEEGSAEAPLTNGLADNARWVWGIFYVNKDDPSILVEKRFGVGYTINFGNWKAVTLIVTFLVLIFGLAALGLVG